LNNRPTIWEKLGAASGLWAALWIGIHYVILRGTRADAHAADSEFVRLLLGERMQWEWVTFLRILGGLMIVWFMGSLVTRLRLAEGGSGRLATIAGCVGTLWGGIWLLSALFNSASISLAATYGDPMGARLAGVLARQSIAVLSPPIVFALSLTTWYVAARFGGFPKAYTGVMFVLTVAFLILAVVEWYGPGNLNPIIMILALVWLGLTSAFLVPASPMSDPVPAGR
jgi:hypothetical protein